VTATGWSAFTWASSSAVRHPRRLANLALVKVQRRLRLSQAWAMPSSYFIDPVNICNLRCPLCPTGRGLLARPRGRMSLARSAPHRRRDRSVRLPHRDVQLGRAAPPSRHRGHDPLRQREAHLRGAELEPQPPRARDGLGAGPVGPEPAGGVHRRASQETYATYRRQGQLDRVLANLRLLLDARREAGTRRPLVIWRMLVGRHNEHEVEEVRQLAHEAGADCFLTGCALRGYAGSGSDPGLAAHGRAVPAARLPAGTASEPVVLLRSVGKHGHQLGRRRIALLLASRPQFDFGNALTASVRQVWTGPHYASARRVVGRRRGRPDDVPTVCHRCEGHPDYLAR
jgi:hypothetical protein